MIFDVRHKWLVWVQRCAPYFLAANQICVALQAVESTTASEIR